MITPVQVSKPILLSSLFPSSSITWRSEMTYRHIVVIGGSIAGLAAATSAQFERVTAIERDQLPQNPDPRAGLSPRATFKMAPRGPVGLDRPAISRTTSSTARSMSARRPTALPARSSATWGSMDSVSRSRRSGRDRHGERPRRPGRSIGRLLAARARDAPLQALPKSPGAAYDSSTRSSHRRRDSARAVPRRRYRRDLGYQPLERLAPPRRISVLTSNP